jgi:DNA-binding CsgD family transcriptional regulator
MPAAWEPDRLVAEVRGLAVRGLPRDEYYRELAARLRRTIAIDATCWHGLDPRTLLLTTARPEELLERGFLSDETLPLAAQAVLASEYERDDYNTFSVLAQRRAPVGILSEATRGRPERSARYREFLSPGGTPFEMRTVFVVRGRAWGCVVFHRSQAAGDFQRADARLLARLSRPIAEGLRTCLRIDAARRAAEESGPGLILLGPRNEVELVTSSARRLLEPLQHDSPPNGSTVPVPIFSLAATARQQRRDHLDDAAVGLYVPSRDGWLSLHASLPDGTRSKRVAIVIQRASREDIAPLRLETYGLTDREREIATLVATGLSTKALADRLFLSPWTVQDHLKSIFDKTDTNSRRELRARIFFEEYLPRINTRTPIATNGALTPHAAHSPDFTWERLSP